MSAMDELLKKIGLDKYVPVFQGMLSPPPDLALTTCLPAAEGFTDPADLQYLLEEDWKRLIPERTPRHVCARMVV